MPELPEVQTVVSQLSKKVVGETITSFTTEWSKNVRPSVARVKKGLKDAKILSVRRFGKHIVIDLETKRFLSHPSVSKNQHLPSGRGGGKQWSLAIHLKMTGHLLVKTPDNENSPAFRDPKNAFIRHIFHLTHGKRIEFSDMRKFAWMELLPTVRVEELACIAALGVDALSRNFTPKRFEEILALRGKQPIGPLLLNQSLIAGIGNIYRSEALFRAKIRPERRVGTLTQIERLKLHESIRKVLHEAVRLRGTSDGDFRDTAGQQGKFQEILYVYRRDGKPCKKCGTIIRRIKLGQRSVFFCSRCQK